MAVHVKAYGYSSLVSFLLVATSGCSNGAQETTSEEVGSDESELQPKGRPPALLRGYAEERINSNCRVKFNVNSAPIPVTAENRTNVRRRRWNFVVVNIAGNASIIPATIQ